MQQLAAPLTSYRVVRVVVDTEAAKYKDACRLVEAKLAARLDRSGKFTRVLSSSAEGSEDLLVQVTIHQLNRVSTEARSTVGALAGRGSIRLVTDAIDAESGATLGTVEAFGRSSGGSVFARGTSEAIDQALDQITDFLTETGAETAQ